MIDINVMWGRAPGGRKVTAREILDRMDRFHVDYSILGSYGAVRYPSEASDLELLRACDRSPRLLPTAAIDLNFYRDPAAEIRRICAQGFPAARIYRAAGGFEPDSGLLGDYAGAAKEAGLPILLDIPAAELARALEHMGDSAGTMVLLGQSGYSHCQVVNAMTRFPGLSLEIRGFSGPMQIETLAQQVGPDRLLFGSNAGEQYFLPTLALVTKAGLPEALQRKILEENPRRLLGGKEAEPWFR